MFSRTKTFIQVWNYLRVSKWWQNFHFWVNYPFNALLKCVVNLCSCGSVVEHCVSSAKGCGFDSQGTHIVIKTCIAWMHCKSLWIKASAKCINVNVIWVGDFHWACVGGAYSCAFYFTESRAVPCYRHAYGEPAVSTREETYFAAKWNHAALAPLLTDVIYYYFYGNNCNQTLLYSYTSKATCHY